MVGKKIAPFMDGAMIDLKSWSEETHIYLTGRSNQRIKKSIKWLSEHNLLCRITPFYIFQKNRLFREYRTAFSFY